MITPMLNTAMDWVAPVVYIQKQNYSTPIKHLFLPHGGFGQETYILAKSQ